MLGSEDIRIPGNKPNVTTLPENICPSTCTSKLSNNITVISNAFHMHTLGLNITTRHVRMNKELPLLGEIPYYDFGHQKQTLVTDPRTRIIAPSDSLRTQCTFTPTLGVRSVDTTYGEATTNEMCYNFVFYYPKIGNTVKCMQSRIVWDGSNWSVCASQSDLDKMGNYVKNQYTYNTTWRQNNQSTIEQWVRELYRDNGLYTRVESSENDFVPYSPICVKSQKFVNAGPVNSTVVTTPSVLQTSSFKIAASSATAFIISNSSKQPSTSPTSTSLNIKSFGDRTSPSSLFFILLLVCFFLLT
jgi:hypothetical protein